MSKTVKQISFTEAIETVEKDRKVWVIDTKANTPSLKDFAKLTVGSVLEFKEDYIFQTIEESENE